MKVPRASCIGRYLVLCDGPSLLSGHVRRLSAGHRDRVGPFSDGATPQHGCGDISRPSRLRHICGSSDEVWAVMRRLAKDRSSAHAPGGWVFMWAAGGVWQTKQRPDQLLDLCSLLSPPALNLLPPASRLENLKNDLPDGVSMPTLY